MNGQRTLVSLLFCLLGLPNGAHAQSIESIEVYRDAAVVYWSSAPSDGGRLAQSFHPFDGPAGIMMQDGDMPLRLAPSTTSDWFGSRGSEAHEEARRNEALLRTDLALKQAQLDLVEEDLAMLRANRAVGGTSEALLVEDLEEASEWMHDAFRDALYRRVELREEVAALELDVQKWQQIQAESAPRRVHGLQLAGSATTPIRTERVETQGIAWSPLDRVEVNLNTGKAQWNRRIQYRLDVPFTGQVTATFIEADWAGPGTTHPAPADGGNAYGRSGSQVKAKLYEAQGPSRLEGASRHRFRAAQPITPGGETGVVQVGSVALSAVSLHQCVPKVAAVVDHWIHVATAGSVLAESDQVHLCLDGECVGQRGLVVDGDTMRVHAGVDEAWNVMRKREAALCNRSVLGSRIKHQQAYSITLENRSTAAGEVWVVEPLPRSSAVEVDVNADDLDGGQWDASTREIHWRLTLKPGETRTLRFQYQLEHDPSLKLDNLQ